MRQHYLKCIENGKLEMFPFVTVRQSKGVLFHLIVILFVSADKRIIDFHSNFSSYAFIIINVNGR